DYAAQGATVIVGEGFALTSTKEVLDAMSDESRRPRRAILVLGYAGWDAEQLEHELVENVWLTCEADEDLLFGQDHNAKWGMALAKIGVDPASLSVFSGTA
ncbi:MAG: YqgE/AlgH family protein, partial [Caulobacteraceae bacterium]